MGDCDVVVKRAHVDFGDFEEDVIVEILARSPVKSLMRFRCVCKSWLTVISGSHFVQKHLSYVITESPGKLIFMMDPPLALDCDALKTVQDHEALESVNFDGDGEIGGGRFAITQLDFPVKQANLNVMFRYLYGACNGLICFGVDWKTIIVWNPSTRDSKMLPSPPQFDILYIIGSSYGFGYDSANDDYKMVRACIGYSDSCDNKEVEIQIFSLKTGLWRTVTGKDYDRLGKRKGLFVNGALHWLDSYYTIPSTILSFDLGKEEYQKMITLPYDGLFSGLFIHRSCLCVSTCPNETNSISIWMMKEYGVKESWTQVLQFSLENYLLDVYDDIDDIIPVCILENGVVLINAVTNSERLLVFSDLKEKTFTHCVNVVGEDDLETVMYQETLVSPNVYAQKQTL